MLFSANQELGGLGASKLLGRIGEFGSLLSRGGTRPKGTVYTFVYLGKPKGNALSNMLKFIKPLERKTGSG